MQASLVNNDSGLRIELVKVVLVGEDVDILLVVFGEGVDQRLGESRLGTEVVVVAWQLRHEKLSKLSAANDVRVHVVIVLVAGSGVITTPGDGVGGSEAINTV